MAHKFELELQSCWQGLSAAQLSLCDFIDGKGYVCPDELKSLYDRISFLMDDIDFILNSLLESYFEQ